MKKKNIKYSKNRSLAYPYW